MSDPLATLEQDVIGIVSEVLSVSDKPVARESHFQNDLGADSLDTVELVMALEEKFEIDIPDEAAEGITTVGEAVEYIRKQRSSASGEG
ncbi:MAG: acyl carrier protein [Cyanobacteria bacterium MAG CAR3_bin_5]|nr:acyl carrier protein [Cyanobacteria bacterium MAG CAR3_bin_5]MCY4235420.1 acyl carrier protein [Cyanobacteria bacterium MAG CAR2_bin_4]MCY4330932.1 acyl carrier protein [Cyanobacteria bacterium MAG CAR1_bin_15]